MYSSFGDYCTTVREEQSSSNAALGAPFYQWSFPRALTEKVSPEGAFLPFYGDTVVLSLSHQARQKMARYQDELYAVVPGLLAEKLPTHTFHVTLHDLTGSKTKESIQVQMGQHKKACFKLFTAFSTYFTAHPTETLVELQPTQLYTSCNISLVMGFVPASEKDFYILLRVYQALDSIVPLFSFPRFHVTLAYLKPRSLHTDDVGKLFNLLHAPRTLDVVLRLDMRELAYQTFDDMKTFHDVFKVSEAGRSL